jgi:hypothetical protein
MGWAGARRPGRSPRACGAAALNDLPLSATDAPGRRRAAERFGGREIASLDRRHFTAVRPSHIQGSTRLLETLR